MIPRLTASVATSAHVKAFLQSLACQSEFHGEIDEAFSSRFTVANDNSVFQVVPEAVIFPRTETDIATIFKLATEQRFRDITFSPRGGGTGTNGQSLCSGIIIDCSRHMNNILQLNLKESWVEVEPGVVLDQLNEFLKPHEVFFAPTLSPSNRATIGGMVNTDASGKGSRLYGKTSQHVLAITSVFPDGQLHTSEMIAIDRLADMKGLPGRVGQFYQQVEQTVTQHKALIEQQMPKLHRFITGYNLTRVFSDDGKQFNANAVLTGSEGTLTYVTKVRLKLTKIPHYKFLFAILYPSFSEALQHAKHLLTYDPEAIETMDGTVLDLAKTDILFHRVKQFLTPKDNMQVRAVNLIEFVGYDKEELAKPAALLKKELSQFNASFIEDAPDIANLWNLRKLSVGLLGKVKGIRKPVSGVEDTVVPPEHLAEYVAEFRKLLDENGLQYGMFGHVDVGCLHVRPAFNLMQESDRQIYYDITKKVAKLTQKYHGVFWGEHGKGFRSEYVPMFFGDVLYEELRKIKTSCDPYNQLNPTKIAIPINNDAKLAHVQSNASRANADIQIDNHYRQAYELPLSCNGNGACFNYSFHDVMCPSYKITRDRRHSPNGRASLTREWLRQLSLAKKGQGYRWPLQRLFNSWQKASGQYDFSHEVYDAMSGCLGCQACQSQCPVNISVPSFKAKFLAAYHGRYARPLKDLLVIYSEHMGYLQSKFPRLNNFFLANGLIKRLFEKLLGFVDPPLFSSPNLKSLLKQYNIPMLDINELPDNKNSVVFIQDWVTSYYEADLVLKTCLFMQKLGYQVYVMPWFANAKTFHLGGMLSRFSKIVDKNSINLQKVADHGLAMVGLDPSMVLTYRIEYPEYVSTPINYQVLLLQEWLTEQLNKNETFPIEVKKTEHPQEFYLLSHCTEQANCSGAQQQWQKIFHAFGLKLTPQSVGCCGMAGDYGHKTEHQAHSRGLFAASWQAHFKDNDTATKSLVDGFSCRAQIKRYTGFKAKHPVEQLLQMLETPSP